MINKFYTVSYFTNFGMRMYLSNVGFHVAAGRGIIFEPEFRNAKKFLIQSEAKEYSKVAAQTQPNEIIIQKHVTNEDGSMVITLV